MGLKIILPFNVCTDKINEMHSRVGKVWLVETVRRLGQWRASL